VKTEKIGGKARYEELKKRGVLVRNFTSERIKDYNRVTIGTKEQMDAFLQAVEEILKGV
jgi:histidinol-phosphate aminotransferase